MTSRERELGTCTGVVETPGESLSLSPESSPLLLLFFFLQHSVHPSCLPLVVLSTFSRSAPSRPPLAMCVSTQSFIVPQPFSSPLRLGLQGRCSRCCRWHWPASLSAAEAEPPCLQPRSLRYPWWTRYVGPHFLQFPLAA